MAWHLLDCILVRDEKIIHGCLERAEYQLESNIFKLLPVYKLIYLCQPSLFDAFNSVPTSLKLIVQAINFLLKGFNLFLAFIVFLDYLQRKTCQFW